MKYCYWVILFFLSQNQLTAQPLYSRKQVSEDLGVLKSILTQTNPVLSDAERKNTANAFDDAIKNFPTDSATAVDFVKYFKSLQIESHYDSHAVISLGENTLPETKIFFPIPIYILGDSIVVNTEQTPIPYGSIIQRINGLRAIDILEKMVGNDIRREFNKSKIQEAFPFNFFVLYGPESEFKVSYTIRPGDSVKTIRLRAADLKTLIALQTTAVFPLDRRIPADSINIRTWVADTADMAYIKIGSFTLKGVHSKTIEKQFTNAFDIFFKNVESSKINHLTIDIRDNNGGLMDIPGLLLSYLGDTVIYETQVLKMLPVENIPQDNLIMINNTTIHSKSDLKKTLYGLYNGFKTKDNRSMTILSYQRKFSRHHFTGEVTLLVNGGTFSAAAYFAALFRKYKRGTIVGTAVGGSVNHMTAGHLLHYQLPHTKLQVTVPLMQISFGNNFSTLADGGFIIPDKCVSFDSMYPSFLKKSDWAFSMQ